MPNETPDREAPAPRIIVKRDEDEISRFVRRNQGKAAEKLQARGLDPRALLNTEVGFLLAVARFHDAPLELDPFQARLLACRESFRSVNKSRQIGYSTFMSLEMLARCILRDRHEAVCVSYNFDEAKSKVELIRELHEELPLGYQKKIASSTKTAVRFESRRKRGAFSGVRSFPSKAPRGSHGDVYIDEFAHVLNDRAVYSGATSVTVRSGGQVTVGSTPLGQRGMFYRIHAGLESEFSVFWRADIPWWLCRQFCRDVETAAREAPLMSTEERVLAFGTVPLMNQFGANLLDDFQQEYELAFQDERATFFPIDLVLACAHKSGTDEADGKTEIHTCDSIEELAVCADHMGPLYAGYDVGRTKHPSELFVLENKDGVLTERYHASFIDKPFHEQEAALLHLCKALGSKLRALRIDRTGIGWKLAEDLRKKIGPKVEEVHFTEAVKSDLAYSLKIHFENRSIDLVKNRATITQLGSVKQKVSESGKVVFDVSAAKNEKHHADRVWALALASWQKLRQRYAPVQLGARILGEKPAIQSPTSAVVPARSATYGREVPSLDEIFEVPEESTPRRPEFVPDAQRGRPIAPVLPRPDRIARIDRLLRPDRA